MSTSTMSIDDYKEIITNYSLDNCKHGNQGYQRLLLQIFGLLGNGKSFFINSCKFVIDGIYEEHAKVTEAEGKSQDACTTRRIPYKLTDVIMMVDNRGCTKLKMTETGEIYAQLGNLLPLGEEVVWCRDYESNVDRLMEEDKKANYTDFIVPIFVHSVKNIIPKEEMNSYRNILKTTKALTGINPLIVLTHKSHGGLTAQQAAFKDMGSDNIYAIENYTKEDHQKTLEKHEEILKLLCQVLNEVDFCMETERNPRGERNDRMGFVLKYMKKADDQERERREEAARREREGREKREREEREKREREEREKREREEREKREREINERHQTEIREREINERHQTEIRERERCERERRERERRERERRERERREREERERAKKWWWQR